MARWIVFLTASALLTAVSWRSLHNRRSHGFYRFFAWEAILVLFLVNVVFWFTQPFAWNQLIAWSLLILSLVPLALGIHSLRKHGNPAQQRENDPSLLGFEKTTTLVTDGIYKHIRHPLYSSLLLLAWGIFFKAPSFLAFPLALIATFFLILTARADELECKQFFGALYHNYMRTTKRFIPYLF